MPEPITIALLAKLAASAAGKFAVKAYFVGKLAALKTFLAGYLGATAANVTTTALATAATVVYWEKHVKKSTDEQAINAAIAKGVSRDVAKGVLKWLASVLN